MSLMTFDFENLPVRAFERDGQEWFVGMDVCRCLGIQNHKDALGRLPTDERDGVGITDPIGRLQDTTCVNEPGLYRLIFTSTKPEAERLKRFVFHEVLPALRRTGAYTPEPDFEILREKMAVIREARLTYGRAAAQAMWREMGLPDLVTKDDPDLSKASEAQQGLWRYLSEFLEDCCEDHGPGRVRTPELHKLYNEWATVAGAPYVTMTAFGLTMRHSPYRKLKTGTTWWLGLRIRDDARRRIDERRKRS